MGYRKMFIWVEGNDDVRFFDKIIKPKLRGKYNLVEIIHYAHWKEEKVDNFLKSIKAMNADYIYLADINESPCVTAKKQEIKGKLKNVDEDRIIIVIKEIESWYLAGLGDQKARKFKIQPFKSTDDITKEQFNDMIPNNFDSRVDFMLEILKNFSIEIAEQKNKSFRYCIEKHNCEVSGNVGNTR